MRVVVERKKLQAPGYAAIVAASSTLVLVLHVGIGAALLTVAIALLTIAGTLKLLAKTVRRRAVLGKSALKAEARYRTDAFLATGWAEISPIELVFTSRHGGERRRIRFAEVAQANLRRLPLIGATAADFTGTDGERVIVTVSAPVSYVTRALGESAPA